MRSPSLTELFDNLRVTIPAEMFVVRPGRVESYDASTQMVSVKPQVRDFSEDSEGNIDQHSLPVISNVPLVFPGIGGFRLTFPVNAGDPVLLLFADRSIDEWLRDGREAAPESLRTHHISDCIAIPGLHPATENWSGVDTSCITIGSDGGNADFVALSTLVNARLDDIKQKVDALVTAYNAHTHPVPGVTTGMSSTTSSVTTSTASPVPTLASVASATVKIKG